MVDTFHISDGSTQRQVFYATGPNAFQIWNKPSNIKFVHFVLIGGGGGGGVTTPSTIIIVYSTV